MPEQLPPELLVKIPCSSHPYLVFQPGNGIVSEHRSLADAVVASFTHLRATGFKTQIFTSEAGGWKLMNLGANAS